MTPPLDKHALFNAEVETTDIQAWGQSVRIRALSCTDIEHLQKLTTNGQPLDLALAWCARYSVINERGESVFDDTDIPKLREQPFVELQKVQKAVFEFNGLGDTARDEIAGN